MSKEATARGLELEPNKAQETADEETGKRERSTIEFPYLDLDDAIEIAKGVHELTGSSCTWEQLAAKLNQAATGGGFRQRMITARLFGLITYTQGIVTLAPLGTRLCDPQQEAAAKADAFLTVPLYKAVYDQFKTGTLPPPGALENAMVGMGVAAKQKEKARQVFQRSATQAGFFALGPNRLVLPAIKASTAQPALTLPAEQAGEGEKKKKQKEDEEEYDPFIRGLLKKLPLPDSDWPMESRAKWLQTAANIFDLMYKDPEDSKRAINIDFKKDSAK